MRRFTGTCVAVALLAATACRDRSARETSATDPRSSDGAPSSVERGRRDFAKAPAFWVWNRPDPLGEAALGDLESHPRTQLYWQVAEIRENLALAYTARPAALEIGEQRRAIPVIRMEGGAALLEDSELTGVLARVCYGFCPRDQAINLQLDFDCPVSRLGDYARWLRSLREELGIDTLTITALASWVHGPEFGSLCGAVDELMPMFYDLKPDPAAEIARGTPRPMIDDDTLHWIERWQDCPIPWRAGLPNFQRVSLFEADGTLVGHLGATAPDHLGSHPAVEFVEGSPIVSQRFRVTADGTLTGVRIRTGQHLVWRMPEDDGLRRAVETARDAGAAGVIWFAHPEAAPRALHSLRHLAALEQGLSPRPLPVVKVETNGRIVLRNEGDGDLPPRPGHAPWTLALESPVAGLFGPILPTDFLGVDAPGASPAHPELARRLELTFLSLRAGEALHSGVGAIRNPEAGPPDWRIVPDP